MSAKSMTVAVFGGTTNPSLTWMLPVAGVELRVDSKFGESVRLPGSSNPNALPSRNQSSNGIETSPR